jgi:hypothetical protein
MKSYIGTKIIKAEPMGKGDFMAKYKGTEAPNPNNVQEGGYHVEYPDGYHSWSPVNVFEEAYREISNSEKVLLTN